MPTRTTPTLSEQLPRPLWQGLVLYRAGYDCEGPGPHLGRLHAHHIDEDKQNNSLENGRCLCGACHTRTHRRLDDETIKKIKEARSRGRSSREIGRELGVSHKTVLRYTTDTPSPIEGWSLIDEDALERMRAARARGETFRSIAQEYGISSATVLRYLRGSARPRPSGHLASRDRPR